MAKHGRFGFIVVDVMGSGIQMFINAAVEKLKKRKLEESSLSVPDSVRKTQKKMKKIVT